MQISIAYSRVEGYNEDNLSDEMKVAGINLAG